MNLFKFENGDPENLEGRVIVYGQVNRVNNRVIAAYICADPLDFRDKFGQARLIEVQAEMKASLEQQGLNDDNSLNQNFPYYNDRIDVSLKDLATVSEDVISVGALNDENQCRLAIIGASMIYMNHYISQLEGRSRAQEDDTIGTSEESNSLYVDMSPLKVHGHLDWNYTGPIFTSLQLREYEKLPTLATDLERFSRGSPIMRDAYALGEVIRGDHNEELVKLYLNKILAIAGERYEEAAKLRDEITSFSDVK